MKYNIKKIENSYKNLFMISYVIFVLHIFIALLLTSVFNESISDYNTLIIILEEIMLSANNTFSVGIIGTIILKILI